MQRCMVASLHRTKKPVAFARERLDVARVGGRITQGLADLVDRRIETLIKIHECVAAPEPLAYFLPCHDAALCFEQHDENLKRLLLQLDSNAILTQFPS